MIKKTRESRGLGKYDAPLKVQFNTGYDGFKYNRPVNPFHKDNEFKKRSRAIPQ